MTTTMDQLVEALKLMADQHAQLGAMLLAAQQQQKAAGGNGDKEKECADIRVFRNVKVFSGDSEESEEFA